jgi:antitoxin VapB
MQANSSTLVEAEEPDMAINIKNEDTERLTRELSELTGEGVTTAVTIAVRERLERVRSEDGLSVEQRVANIMELGRQLASALGPSSVQIDDLYDNNGLPA